MASFFSQPASAGADTESTTGERYTRALMHLTRQVWHPECSFDTAIGLICECAAAALQVDRVNVWRYDTSRHCLQCIHAYTRDGNCHAGIHELETLSLDDNDYVASLHEVRAIDATDVESDPSTARSVGALRDYLRRHAIRALLDAPVRVEGELLGVICHESVGCLRDWTREEAAFAGSMGDFIAMAYEVARRLRAEQQIRHLRLHDATTDLPNRDYLVELIGQHLATPLQPGHVLAVVHVQIHATHGTAMSPNVPTLDEVMAQVALCLRQFADYRLSLARVRADAFALLAIHYPDQQDVVHLAERCLAAVRALPQQHEEIEPGAAIGIAFAVDDERDARVLMRKAEQAADRARGEGAYRFEVFDLDHHQGLVQRLHLERALQAAFDQQRFELHYQPEYDTRVGTWSGAEALLRWRTDERLVEAAEFIEAVEESDLMVVLGRWVLLQACRDAACWPERDGAAALLRVNVSARQFDHSDLAADVADALAQSGLPPHRLCLEITETTLMRDIDRPLPMLRRLSELGVRIAIDDFGTGYSSLVYLKRFPVDTLKIDRGFVQGLPRDAVDTAIVSAVFGLAASLGIEVVAEGVERAEQQLALEAVGVHRMQGWLYARAMAQAQLCELLGADAG